MELSFGHGQAPGQGHHGAELNIASFQISGKARTPGAYRTRHRRAWIGFIQGPDKDHQLLLAVFLI